MEKGIDFLSLIRSEFAYETVDIKTYSPLTLAYIGDGIYELVIRTILVEHGNRATNTLHKTATKYVNAGIQANMVIALKDDLTEEEHAVYRRGRNAKSHSAAKNASLNDYRKATGFEALMGYLYLTNQQERLVSLIKLGLEKLELHII